MTTVTYSATDAAGAPSDVSMIVDLGGVTDGVFSLVRGWGPDGQVVDSVSFRVVAGLGQVDLIPTASISPANTVYRVYPQSNPRAAQYITVPAGGPFTVQDLLTAEPAQPDATVQGATLTLVNNGDGTGTVYAAGTATLADNGDGTGTLTVGS